jgi:hypothetical protein
MMKKYLTLALLAGLFTACASGAQESSENGTAAVAEQAESHASQASPSAHDAAASNKSEGSILPSLKNMAIEEALEIDDFRERIGKDDWGQVMSILKEMGAEFEPSGTCCLVAKGASTIDGSPWVAWMIVDLEQDAVFGAQHDGENNVVNTWEDDKEGLHTPEPMKEFMKIYNN